MRLTHEEKMAATEYLVEADSYSLHSLWKEYSDEYTGANYKWQQDCAGMWEIIGHLDKMPVTVSVSWYLIEGIRIAFYEGVSQVVDYRMVEKWLKKNFKQPYAKNNKYYSGIRHSNAMNFQHCLDYIKNKTGKEYIYKGPKPIWQQAGM